MTLRSARVGIVVMFVGGFLGTEAFAQTPMLPLAVERASTANDNRFPGGPMLSFDLYNNGTKAITAWGYWVELTLSDGTTRRDPHTSDALPASEPADYILAAKGRRTETAQLREVSLGEVTGLTVKVAALIFEDATAAGDESMLTFLFARRAQHRQTWNALHAIVSVAQAQHGDPLEVLEKVKADIEGADPKLRDSGDYSVIRQRVLVGLQGVRPAQSVLTNLIRTIKTHRDMFETQTTRRPNQH